MNRHASSTDGILRDLARFGPGCRIEAWTPGAARSYCRHLVLTHRSYLTTAAPLLPRPLLRHWHSLGAFWLWGEALSREGGAKALAALRWWREELLTALDGPAHHPVMLALRGTVSELKIPTAPFLDLLFALEQDQLVKRYRTYDQLLDYCGRAAHPWAQFLLVLFRCDNTQATALAQHLGTGLQLAHLWQNVRHEIEQGRVYLPDEDRARFGYTDADLAERRQTPELTDLLAFEAERARELLYRGLPLVDLVPPDLARLVEAAVGTGLGCLKAIGRSDYQVWRERRWEWNSPRVRFLRRVLFTAIVRRTPA